MVTSHFGHFLVDFFLRGSGLRGEVMLSSVRQKTARTPAGSNSSSNSADIGTQHGLVWNSNKNCKLMLLST